MNHFDKHNFLNPFQHGYHSKHSCETQLIGFAQEIFDKLESGKQTNLIIKDFSKVKKIFKLKIKRSKKLLIIPTLDPSLSIAPLYGTHGRIHYRIELRECRGQQLDML